MKNIDKILTHYIEAALWSSLTDAARNDQDTTEEGEFLDENWNEDDIGAASKEDMKADVEKFVKENAVDLEEWDEEQIGHDFWLTRCGHGAGFWDRDIGTEESRDRLSKAAEAFGERHLFVSGDKIICE